MKKETKKYYKAVGRRKTAVARVRLFSKGKNFLVNQKPVEDYFPILELQKIAKAALNKVKGINKFGISVIVKGGGIHAQAEAVRHGIARALILYKPNFKKELKEAGFLKRDPRMRERKKFGLKRARRAPQWQKR
ncbi:30S ribosomal protein S9 [Parcubacteria bacterium DG_74_2]|nr:MAG: 30S ribosomal protein S9 [Parcubacteria bacterium DG_74_2]